MVPQTFPNHPEYDKYYDVWTRIDDCLEGSEAIHNAREKYLPKTEGMASDAQYGDVIYNRYLNNATYPEYAHDFFIASTGLLKQKDPQLNFPDVMVKEFVPSPSYEFSKSFLDVYSEVQDGVMKYSRCGVLLDMPDTNEKRFHDFPVMLTYDAYKIINWGYRKYHGRNVLAWVLIDESYDDADSPDFSRNRVSQYRFLGLKTQESDGSDIDKPLYYTYTGGENIVGVFNPPRPSNDGTAIDPNSGTSIIYPHNHGKYMNRIPFFCFTGTSMSLTPEKPISQSLCDACLNIYRLYADYREYLYKQGFAILFGKGMESDTVIYTGTNKAIIVQSTDADLKMVESSGNGLAEYRLAIANAEDYAKSLGLSILKGNGDETGVSVAKRQGFKTASLKSISKTLAEGFTQIAKTAAEWVGLPQEQIDSISIIPNVDFSSTVTTSDMTILQNLADAETPILSEYDVYQNLRSRGVTALNTFDEYLTELKETRKNRDQYLLDKKIKETEAMNELQLKMTAKQQEMQPDAAEPSDQSDSFGDTKPDPDKVKASGEDTGDMSKEVICVETGKKYKSATEAGKDVGVSGAAITRALRGDTKTAGRLNNTPLHWKYAK
jgi:hypothetical protein